MRCETPDVAHPAHFLVAHLRWDSEDDAMAALGSPEGKAAVADLNNFAGADIEFGEVNTPG